MKRLKSLVFFLLTSVIIIFGGMLPFIAGNVQDSLEGQAITLEKIKTVQFFNELTDIEKLSLICFGEMAEVSEEKANMNTKEVQTTAISILETFGKNGMIPLESDYGTYGEMFWDFNFYAEPILLYNNTSSQERGIFWLIDLKSADGIHSISMCIDDQDGKLMIISYYKEAAEFYEALGYMKEELLNIFCETYFTQISLWDDNLLNEISNSSILFYDKTDGAMSVDGEYNISDMESTDDYAAVNFFWEDTQKGALDMHFVVHSSGFYNEWQ